MPEPELVTTGIGQPLILASEPAAAFAINLELILSPKVLITVLPILAPQSFFKPSLEILVLYSICLSNKSFTSSILTSLAKSKIDLIVIDFLSM